MLKQMNPCKIMTKEILAGAGSRFSLGSKFQFFISLMGVLGFILNPDIVVTGNKIILG